RRSGRSGLSSKQADVARAARLIVEMKRPPGVISRRPGIVPDAPAPDAPALLFEPLAALLALLLQQSLAVIPLIMPLDLGGGGFLVLPLDLGLAAGVGPNLSLDLGGSVDEQPAAIVDDIAADIAADDHLGLLGHPHIAGHIAEDMHPAAFLHDQVAVDQPAGVKLAALDDGDIAPGRSPEGERLIHHHIPRDPATFLTHGRLPSMHSLIWIHTHAKAADVAVPSPGEQPNPHRCHRSRVESGQS